MKRTTLLVAVLALVLAAFTSEAAEVRLWRLDCGTIQVNDLSLFSDTFRYVGMQKTLTDSCYLIQHDSDSMLWDAGLPASLLNAPLGGGPMTASLKKTLVDQLKTIDIRPETISKVGVSHYHFDHVGQAADFPKAKLLIGRADYNALTADPLPFGLDPSLLQPWLQGASPVEKVTGDKDIYGDGSVVMLATPGHTPGSYALLVRLGKTGPVLLSGDAMIFEDQLDTNGVPPFNTDRAQSLASMARLQEIAKTLQAKLIVQHDADDIGKLPAFPASAD
jgi:N-acyl homoserine lactone hydrolase